MPGYEKLEAPSSGSTDKKGAELIRLANKAFTTPERYNAQTTWALMSEFILPSVNRSWFQDVSKGQRRDRRVFDSTAINANRDLASAMHSTITNPAMHWSKLRFRDDKLNDIPEGMDWLDKASEEIHNALNDCNFDSQIAKGYLTISGLGHMVLFHEEDFVFTAWHIAEVAYVEDKNGMIDTIYRRFRLTVKQAYEKFGDAIGEAMMEKLEKQPLDELIFYHCIYPRDENKINIKSLKSTGQALPKERPYESCYVMNTGSKVVKEDGYYEFPCYVARWSNLPGETYGFGPGNVAIADIRSLNKIWEESLKALAKSVNPTIMVTKQNMVSGDFRPGALTVVRDIEGLKEFVTQSNLQAIEFAVQKLETRIKEHFYIDKLMLPPRTETGEMSALEVQARLSQMQQILGPVLSRLNSELLNPLVIRCLKILIRNGRIKPLPQSVVEQLHPSIKGNGTASPDLDIMFVNSLARSQQMAELQNVQQFVQEVMQMAQGGKPEALDKLNGDALVDYSAKIRNIPENLIMTDDDVKKMRQDRQEQQQQLQQAQLAEQGSNAVKNVGQAAQAVGAAQQSTKGGPQ